MFKKYAYIVIAALLLSSQAWAQFNQGGTNTNRQTGSGMGTDQHQHQSDAHGKNKTPDKPSVAQHIETWGISRQGSLIKRTELDTSAVYYHIYQPIFKESISNTFIGNNGGAYESNDFFNRTYNSDFYFARSFNAYQLMPSQIKYYNTTTPYSLLDYSQSENKNKKNETRFNVLFSRNVNKKLNFTFIYDQTKSQGHYLKQTNKFHNIGIVSSYISDPFVSHSNIIFNRLQGQENGGVVDKKDISKLKSENLLVRMDDALNKLQNNNLHTTNEYRLGKYIEADTVKKTKRTFIPRVGFIHEFDLSSNKRSFFKENPKNFFKQCLDNDTLTNDSTTFTRATNIFQIKFYEAPDRKYTFGKRVYIGNDILRYDFSLHKDYFPDKQTNTFIGGGIFRNEGKFWQWEANGRIYLTGYRSGQTELEGFINKPLLIGKKNTSLRVEGSIKTMVPDYYERYFFSNHFKWSNNNFNNINEMTIRSALRANEQKTTIGVNYSLISNYIYNNEEALPTQAKSELLVVSAYLNKDFERDHWAIKIRLLTQKANNDLVRLPVFAGLASMNYRTVISKVMYFQLGADIRYNSLFYADAYEPATARFYHQNTQKIGEYPFIDLHANLKLKRTRVFFMLMNAASSFMGDNFLMAPDYPYYQSTFRFGVAWSFYD